MAMKGYSTFPKAPALHFWLAVRLSTGLRVRFLYPTPDDCALGPLVQRFYWLANHNHILEDSEKGMKRLKAGSANGRLEALATLFATTAALSRVLNLTVPGNIGLLKTDSRLTVIASQLITELKVHVVVVVVVVHDSYDICKLSRLKGNTDSKKKCM